jgi:hypothetical protein
MIITNDAMKIGMTILGMAHHTNPQLVLDLPAGPGTNHQGGKP